jgi:hypothetical protein
MMVLLTRESDARADARAMGGRVKPGHDDWEIEQDRVGSSMAARPVEEVVCAFRNQCKALASSCAAYDGGEKWEAGRIAVAVVTLVHDRGKSHKSILTRLGVRESILFASSGPPHNPRNLMREMPLVISEIGGWGGRHVPILDTSPYLRGTYFSEWWDSEIILRDGSHMLTRSQLSDELRNVEGDGAHFDMELRNPNYVQLAREQISTPYLLIEGDNEPIPMLDAHHASMRQIGWELLETFELNGMR